MDLAKRTEILNAGIRAQKIIKAKCESDGDAVGAKRAQKAIDKYNKELNELGRQV